VHVDFIAIVDSELCYDVLARYLRITFVKCRSTIVRPSYRCSQHLEKSVEFSTCMFWANERALSSAKVVSDDGICLLLLVHIDS
jgi:hypothetical protein